MVEHIKELDNFLLELKNNFIREFPQLFGDVKDNNNGIKSGFFKNILGERILTLYTDENGYFKTNEYLNSNDAKIEYIFNHCTKVGNFAIIKFLFEFIIKNFKTKTGVNTIYYFTDTDTDNPAAKINIGKILSNSAKEGYLEIVKYLVENGAKINCTSALYYSIQYDHFEVVKYLVEQGAKINCPSVLLHSLLCGKDLDIANLLKESSTKIDNSTTN